MEVNRCSLPFVRQAHLTDYSLPAGHPMSFEVDEIVPVSKGGDPLDFENTQPTHRVCNQRKGNGIARKGKPPKRGLPTSRDW